MGIVTSLQAGNGEVVGSAELLLTESTRSPVEDVNAGLKSGLSFGFLVHKTRLLKSGEAGYDEDGFSMIVEGWEPYECSAVATPRGVRSKITGGLTGSPERDSASVSTDAKTAPRRPRKAPRRPLNASLERESSPPPKRPLTIPLQRDYMKEQHAAITASLAGLDGSPASPQEDTASPLAKILGMASSPSVPDLHHKVGDIELVVNGGRGWCKLPLAVAMQPAQAHQAAFTTTNAYGAIGEDAGGAVSLCWRCTLARYWCTS